MKSAIAAQLPDEHFVIRVDGRVKSHHRRFLDALREGLQLRDQFPRHDVKVQLMAAESQQRTALPWSGALSQVSCGPLDCAVVCYRNNILPEPILPSRQFFMVDQQKRIAMRQ
jgi:hypothetical protein